LILLGFLPLFGQYPRRDMHQFLGASCAAFMRVSAIFRHRHQAAMPVRVPVGAAIRETTMTTDKEPTLTASEALSAWEQWEKDHPGDKPSPAPPSAKARRHAREYQAAMEEGKMRRLRKQAQRTSDDTTDIVVTMKEELQEGITILRWYFPDDDEVKLRQRAERWSCSC
jgi:hypothetical protein